MAKAGEEAVRKNKMLEIPKKLLIVMYDSLLQEIDEVIGRYPYRGVSLSDEISKIFPKILLSEITDIYTLSLAAETLQDYTRKWTFFSEAWKSHNRVSESNQNDDKFNAIHYGEKLLEELINKSKYIPITPIIVPFMEKMCATGFNCPIPIIVSPICGLRQVWSWFGYAHELGHHIYRNIEGLRDELIVHVIGTLSLNGIDYNKQRIWFDWLEEVFADIFGILKLGTAFAKSQQYMFFYLPEHIVRLFKNELEPEADNLDEINKMDNKVFLNKGFLKALLYAADDTHPLPYLRARIAIKTLEKLIEYSENNSKIKDADQLQQFKDDVEVIKKHWDNVFKDSDVKKVRVATNFQFSSQKQMLPENTWGHFLKSVDLSFGNINQIITEFPDQLLPITGKAYIEISADDMDKAIDIVIDTILNTPLAALEETTLTNEFYNCSDRNRITPARAILNGERIEYDGIKIQDILIAAIELMDKKLIDGKSDEIPDLNYNVLKVIGKTIK